MAVRADYTCPRTQKLEAFYQMRHTQTTSFFGGVHFNRGRSRYMLSLSDWACLIKSVFLFPATSASSSYCSQEISSCQMVTDDSCQVAVPPQLSLICCVNQPLVVSQMQRNINVHLPLIIFNVYGILRIFLNSTSIPSVIFYIII